MRPFLTDTGRAFRGLKASRTVRCFESAWSAVTGGLGDLRIVRGPQVLNTRGCGTPTDGMERGARDLAINLDSPPQSKDDNLAQVAAAATTFADSGRQDFGLQINGDWSVLPSWGLPAFYGQLSEEASVNSVMMRVGQVAGRATHVRQLMGSGLMGRKASVNTTKNDNIENCLYRLQFSRKHCGPLADSFRRLWSRIGGHEGGLAVENRRLSSPALNQSMCITAAWFVRMQDAAEAGKMLGVSRPQL